MLLALALGTFAVGTESFMIAAILPAIASSVRVGAPAAGQLVTAFTLVYALSSPILTALTASHSRRILLLGSLGAFLTANLFAAAATSYWALMGARVLLAIAAGLYVPPPLTIASARPRRDGCTIVPANAFALGPDRGRSRAAL
jgi:predicted MFS family arabinose efflux permease